MAVFFFNNVVGFVLAAMLEGTTLPSSTAAKTKTCLCRKKFDSYTPILCKRYHSIFLTLFLKLKCKISVHSRI